MLPETTKTNQLSAFQFSENKNVRRKQELLCIPEVTQKMTPVEVMVCQATVSQPIKSLPADMLAQKINVLAGGVCRDIGIKETTGDDFTYKKARFTDILSKYYPEMSISSVKLAFELLLVGELDDYLPKDKNGNPEKAHYQDFSVEYYTKVLNAFKKKSGDVWYKVRQNAPKLEIKASDQQIKQNRNMIIEDIYQKFDDYKENGTVPNFDLEIFINVLIENGLVEKQPPTTESVDTAYNKLLLSDYLTRLEKKQLIDDYDKKKKSHTLTYNAQGVENNKTIANYFQTLLAEKKDIRDVLKKID